MKKTLRDYLPILMMLLCAAGFGALLLTGVIAASVGLTLLVSRILSATVLRGEAVSFALELPPYRRPQPKKILTDAIFGKTLHVLSVVP